MTRDQELTLLGLLEFHFGERQRAMGGVHLDPRTSREQHLEMIALQHRAAERHLAEALAATAAPRATAWPAAVAIGLVVLAVLVVLVLAP